VRSSQGSRAEAVRISREAAEPLECRAFARCCSACDNVGPLHRFEDSPDAVSKPAERGLTPGLPLGARPKARVTGEGSAPSGDAPPGATRRAVLKPRLRRKFCCRAVAARTSQAPRADVARISRGGRIEPQRRESVVRSSRPAAGRPQGRAQRDVANARTSASSAFSARDLSARRRIGRPVNSTPNAHPRCSACDNVGPIHRFEDSPDAVSKPAERGLTPGLPTWCSPKSTGHGRRLRAKRGRPSRRHPPRGFETASTLSVPLARRRRGFAKISRRGRRSHAEAAEIAGDREDVGRSPRPAAGRPQGRGESAHTNGGAQTVPLVCAELTTSCRAQRDVANARTSASSAFSARDLSAPSPHWSTNQHVTNE
jgi:hypothetical protein